MIVFPCQLVQADVVVFNFQGTAFGDRNDVSEDVVGIVVRDAVKRTAAAPYSLRYGGRDHASWSSL